MQTYVAIILSECCKQVSNVYIVATTRSNTNIAMLFSLLHRICQVEGFRQSTGS